ncbi:heterokaryon incompatibility protein [Neofusicoccum parvum]|nr:heterokaryon incompatibility protein [Neofusicoccum parvum]
MPYATLSHSWGHTQSLRLIQNNLEILQNGINIETLPRTFQHAVCVARKLGLRYLWIDSLCILQDSADDWRRESAMMRHVYSNGSLNIAATAASGDQDGLSFQRNPHSSRHITVNITWKHPDLVSHKPPGRYYIFNGGIWDREVESAPLNKRGWVLQERSLSPRILHFGRTQLYWQCNTALRSEMFPRDLRTKNLGPHVPRVTSRFTTRLRALQQQQSGQPAATEHELAGAHAHWSELVNAYSATRLSRPADKLIAVQALAETMQDATGDAYVAGLWRSRLAEDVLWRTDVDERRPLRRPARWRAPTWSWASLDAQVESRGAYHYVGRRAGQAAPFFVREMVPSVEGFGGVETGQLRSARLKVRGLLYRSGEPIVMKVMDEPLSLSRPARAEAPWSLKVFLDEWDEQVVHAAEHTVPAGSLFFPVGSPIAGTVEGLVLEPVAERDGEFQRIAFFEIDVLEPGGADSLLKGLQILEDAENLGHLKDGEDSEGRTVYQFTLI